MFYYGLAIADGHESYIIYIRHHQVSIYKFYIYTRHRRVLESAYTYTFIMKIYWVISLTVNVHYHVKYRCFLKIIRNHYDKTYFSKKKVD
jgi:hypothetical protein